ncbi:MAG: DUF885 domain-containing protein [Phycisphaerales bacterium]|nr:DUF885 domain-containing protein [Phycisphaerales bacterium]
MRMRALILPLVLTLAPFETSASSQEIPPATQFESVLADAEAYRRQVSPEYAMSKGDDTRAGELRDVSPRAHINDINATRDFLERIIAIDVAMLSTSDQLDYRLFRRQLEMTLEGDTFGDWMMPINARSGPHQDIPQMGDLDRLQTELDFEHYAKRLTCVAGQLLQLEETLRAGLAAGKMPPRLVIEAIPQQIRTARESALDRLRTPLTKFPASMPAATRARITQEIEATIPLIADAMLLFEAFLIADYLPMCRATTAASDMEGGADWYAFQLRSFTTTALTAQEIHDIGKREVARIRGEMMTVIAKTDWSAADLPRASLSDDARFAQFIEYLRTAPRFYCTTAEELLARYRSFCKEVDPHLPELFGTCPRLTYGVREIPRFMAPSQTTAYYQQGSPKRGEPGWFYANTYRLDMRPTYEIVPLSLHEAVPGHHFQISLANELEGTREFRKDLDSTAFVEGWALYCERLGIEMGFFTDPYDDFGRLLYEMWRATRLVVDTGLHAFGWTREQAIAYMTYHTALSALNIENEVERYIGWPGQATGYKIGELCIRALRAEAETTLGSAFDIRRFHDAVLLNGPLPLDVLEATVRAWIASEVERVKLQAQVIP